MTNGIPIPFKTEKQHLLPRSGTQSPLRLLAIVAISIFATEAAVMLAFMWLPPLTAQMEVIVDSILLTVLVSPILYLFLFRPLSAHIAALQKAQDLLQQQRGHLEEEVQHRTAELNIKGQTTVSPSMRSSWLLQLCNTL